MDETTQYGAGFYLPLEDDAETGFLYAPNFVSAPTFEIAVEADAGRTDLPGGWQWHDQAPEWVVEAVATDASAKEANDEEY